MTSSDVTFRQRSEQRGSVRRSRDQDAYRHFVPLLAEYAALPADHPDRKALRDEIVTGYLPVVQHIARRFNGRGQPLDDLEQAGAIGLIGAVDRYDPSRGSEFLAFAIPTITGEIRRYFRDHTWMMSVPRRLRDIQSAISSATEVLSSELGRAPRPSELARRMDVPLDEVLEALDATNAYRAGSLDASVNGVDLALSEVAGFIDGELEKVEYRHSLGPLLARLPERERKILALRFFGEMTQTQVANWIGLSQMHVSRLLAQTFATLRHGLISDEPVEPAEPQRALRVPGPRTSCRWG